MCKLCDDAAAEGRTAPIDHRTDRHPLSAKSSLPRRSFFRLAAGTAGAVTGLALAGCGGGAEASEVANPSGVRGSGETGVRTLLRGATVLSMDPAVGNFARADVLIEGSKIVQVASSINAPANIVSVEGMILMPGFIDTHHHQFETAIRGLLADSILRADGTAASELSYVETVLSNFAPRYRPEDVYISELVASLSQLDAGVTTVLDVSQIHNSPEHSDAAITALNEAGRRAVFGYFEGSGPNAKYPLDARRIKERWFASQDQLVTMAMGAEIYLPGYEIGWALGRELGIPVVCHVVGSERQSTMEALGRAKQIRSDNLFIHMTGQSDSVWNYVKDAGAKVTMAVPIEMAMRHGMPPLQKALDMGVPISLSSDVECTMTADMFTIMRSAFTLQRMFSNQLSITGQAAPALLRSRDLLRMATIEGAKALGLESKTGSISPGKDADIILLDPSALNAMPLNNAAGAIVTLMDRSNVSGVLVAGKVRKWNGKLLDIDLARLRADLERSRDYLFSQAGISQNVLRGV